MTKQKLPSFIGPVAAIVASVILVGLISFIANPWIALALSLVLTVGILTLFKVRALPYLILVGLILGQLVRLKLSGESSGSLLAIDLINAAYVGIGLVYALATKQRFRPSLFLIFIGAFLAWMTVSILLGASQLTSRELIVALFYLVRFGLMIGTIVVTAMLFQTELQQRGLFRGFLVAGILLVLLGFAQLVFVPDFAFMAKFGWDPHSGRLLSTFFDPNFFGMFLVMLFSFFLAKLFYAETLANGLWLSAGLALTGLATLATLSRSTYLALVIATLGVLLIRSWKLVVITLIGLAIVGFSIPKVRERIIGATQIDATAQDRIQSWKETFTIIQDNPVTGVGYNAFGPAQLRYGFKKDLQGHSSRGSDSSLLLVLATTGFIGLALYLVALLSLYYEAVLVYRLNPSPLFKTTALATLGILPAYIVHSQFVNGLFYPLLLIPFGFFIASTLVGLQKLKG